MKCCKYVGKIAVILTVIGALNWGLWGFFQFDLVAWLCGGNTTWLSRFVYAIVGIAGLLSLKSLCCCRSKACPCCHKPCPSCNEKGGSCSTEPKSKSGGCCSK